MVVHQTDHVLRQCPRFLSLIARFSHVVQINRTHEHIRELQDAFLVLDSQHYVRRSVAAFYRGAMGIGDDVERARHAPALHGDLGGVLPGRFQHRRRALGF